MFVIDETYQPITNPMESSDKYYWVYDSSMGDLHLKMSTMWYSLTTEAYRLSIGDSEVVLPGGYHIAIASDSGDVDWVRPVEIVGRDFDALQFTRDLKSGVYELSPMRVVGYEPIYEYVLPFTTHPILTLASQDRVVLLSELDQYKKIPRLHALDII